MASRASIRRGWKRVESRIADRLNGKRLPTGYRVRGERADVDHKTLSIEVKSRKNGGGKFLEDAMDQAVKSIKTDEQMPVVILHKSGRQVENDYAVLRMRDFEELLKALGRLDDDE